MQRGSAANLEQSFTKHGVFSSQQPTGHIGVGNLQEVELWRQGQADTLLGQ